VDENLRIGIVARLEIPGALKLVRKVMGLLSAEEILLEREVAKKLGKPLGTVRALRKADAVVTVGGDGTVLFAQRLVPKVPILGVNLGEKGFLADVKPNEIEQALMKLKAGKLQLVEQDRLAGTAHGKRLPDALNDVVVFSAITGKTLAAKVAVDGEMAMNLRGDGVVVSTPTGSTAYAHAAGGPVVDPRLKAILVVPICQSYPRLASLIVPMDSQIEIEPTRPGRDAQVIVDGMPATKLKCGEKVVLSRSDNPALFFRWCEFYRKTREKLQ
jgi:NAD+ kinase